MCPRTWSGRYAVCLGGHLPSQRHWTDQLVGPNNAYLVKRKTAGGSQFSKDPLNLMNKHSRKVKTLYNSLRVSNINANVVCRIRQQQGTYSQNDDIEDERRRRQWIKKTDLENMIQAVGVQPGEKGGVRLLTKKTKHLNRPSANGHEVSWSGQKGGPKSVSPLIQSSNTAANNTSSRVYKGIVNYTAKQGYRADLRREAVARASAIKQSAQPKKEDPEPKLRGSRAKKA